MRRIVATALILGTVALSGCNKDVLQARLKNEWPCGVVDMTLSPNGDNVVLTRREDKTYFNEIDLKNISGRIIKYGGNDITDVSILYTSRSKLSTFVGLGIPFLVNGNLYVDSGQNLYRNGEVVHDYKYKFEHILYRQCHFDYLIPSQPDVIPGCLTQNKQIYTENESFQERLASAIWSSTDMEKISNPLVIFDVNGLIDFVIERGELGQALAIYRSPNSVFRLKDPDNLSFILPTVTESGRLGFWTDTPNIDSSGQVVEYELTADGEYRVVASFSDKFHSISFVKSSGGPLDRYLPTSSLVLGPEVGPYDGQSMPILATQSLIRFNEHGKVWLSTDSSHTESILYEPTGSSARVLATCRKAYPQAVSAVLLKTEDFGEVPAYWTVFDGNVHAPLAIEFHGGPAGTPSQPQNAKDLFESATGVALRTSGLQVLSIEYPGSGVAGRAYRGALTNQARKVARETLDAANTWAQAIQGNTKYYPLVVGTSYGAYLAASALSDGIPNTRYILDSGIYDPNFEISESQYFVSNRELYTSDGFFFSPTRKILKENKLEPGLTVVISYSTGDKTVSPNDSIQFGNALKASGAKAIVFMAKPAPHGLSLMEMANDKNGKGVLTDLANQTGPFNQYIQ